VVLLPKQRTNQHRRGRVLQNLIVAEQIKKFSVRYGTWSFIAMFSRARHWILSWSRRIQSTTWCNIYLSSSVCIATSYGLDDRSSRVRFPAGAGNFSLHDRVQNGSGAHPALYSVGTGSSFHEVKRRVRQVDHSPPSSAEVKHAWSYTSAPPYVFMVWCLVKHRDNFTFYLYITILIFSYHLSLNLQCYLPLSSLLLKFSMQSRFFHAAYMASPSCIPWGGHSNFLKSVNISVKFSICLSFHLFPNILLNQIIIKYPQSVFLPYSDRSCFSPI
jgi:hypothetical protein